MTACLMLGLRVAYFWQRLEEHWQAQTGTDALQW